MAADVFFHAIPESPDHELAGPDLTGPVAGLTRRMGLSGSGRPPVWGLKVEVGPPGRRSAIGPDWARAVAGALAGSPQGPPPVGSFCFDTLSITTRGLEEVESHLDLARGKGFGAGLDGLPFLVADGPDQGRAEPLRLADSDLEVGLAAGAARAEGLCVLNAVRSHPHTGFQGAVSALGLGLVDREGKIALHRDIRPSVNTPLCAGCGSCLDVCLFDAIVINAGRAYIEHEQCTGCGECMTVCFMAGIASEEQDGILRFQARVAESARAVRTRVTADAPGRAGYFNFMIDLGRQGGSEARSRHRKQPGTLGILASTDPVALDQATWDLVTDRIGGPLHEWCGYRQEPDALLDRAAELDLGSREYRLREA